MIAFLAFHISEIENFPREIEYIPTKSIIFTNMLISIFNK